MGAPRSITSARADRRLAALACLGPAGLVLVAFLAAPAALSLLLSFTDMGADLEPRRWTLDNYAQALAGDARLPRILLQTFVYAGAVSTAFGVALAAALSVAAYAAPPRAAATINMVWLLPRVAPAVVYVMIWGWAVDPGGPLSGLAGGDLRLEAPLLLVIVATGLASVSFGLIVFTAMLRSLPLDLVRAARIDGAGAWGVMRDVVAPHLKSAVTFVWAAQFLSLLGAFQLIFLLTGGGPNFESAVYVQYVYQRSFEDGLYAYGAALSTVLVVTGGLVAFALRGSLRRAAGAHAAAIETE